MLKATLAAALLFSTITTGQVDTARRYRIDTNHSTVGFSVPIMRGLSKVNGNLQTSVSFSLTTRKTSPNRQSMSLSRPRASILELQHVMTI